MKPYYEDDWVTMYCGDALEVLEQIEPGSIQAVIADPPYSSGGAFRSDRNARPSAKYVRTDAVHTCRVDFSGDNRDQRSYLAWSSMWLGRCYAIAEAGAVAMVFSDWRQVPTLSDALQCGGWVWRNLVTWWKQGIRMQRGRFSLSSEFVLYGSAGIAQEGEISPQSVLVYRPVRAALKQHIAEKPIGLVKTLVGVTPESACVLDPFMGSGTTLVAAKALNRRAIGIEIEERWCEVAVQRLGQMPLGV